MRPADAAAFLVPLILAPELQPILWFQAFHMFREIDVVTDKQRVSRIQPHEEALVSRTLDIVREYLEHNSVTLDYQARLMRFVEMFDLATGAGAGAIIRALDAAIKQRESQEPENYPDLHFAGSHVSPILAGARWHAAWSRVTAIR